MSLSYNSLKISGPITPNQINNIVEYPTHYSKFGCGGLHYVKNIDELNQIPLNFREIGMIVYVESEEESPFYILYKTIENDGWKKLSTLIFNDNMYFTYISPNLPPDNIDYPSVIWINPETGQFFYRSDNSSEWNEIFYLISNIDGGDFSNI